MTDTTNGQAFYKGFDKNMQCRGFQYAEGGTYVHEGQVDVCHSGFHACALPLDVFSYYPPRDGNRYRAVALEGVAGPVGDSKVAGREITIGASVNVFGLVKAHVEAIWKRATEEKEALGANAATTGDDAHAATTGDRAHAATTGDDAHAATTGRWANAATTGYGAHAAAEVADPNAIAAVLGRGKAKGVVNSWLVLTERDTEDTILSVKAIQVDGETVKGGVFYTLRDGELVEVGE